MATSLSQMLPAMGLLLFIISLPWLVQLAKKRGWLPGRLAVDGGAIQLVSAQAVGPQQKVLLLHVQREAGLTECVLVGVSAERMDALARWTQADVRLPIKDEAHLAVASGEKA